jgi:predicted TIM-barrel enzyme
MLWVNGNVVLKETLLDEPVEPSSDYNAILAEGIDTHRRDFSEHIDRVKNTKVKCVAILAEAGIKIEDIAKVMKCAKRTIYRIRDNDGE